MAYVLSQWGVTPTETDGLAEYPCSELLIPRYTGPMFFDESFSGLTVEIIIPASLIPSDQEWVRVPYFTGFGTEMSHALLFGYYPQCRTSDNVKVYLDGVAYQNEEEEYAAWLYLKVPFLSASEDTTLLLYFKKTAPVEAQEETAVTWAPEYTSVLTLGRTVV